MPLAPGAEASADRPAMRGAFAIIGISQILISLDFSIVSVGLAHIQSDLHLDPSLLQWVIGAWGLTFGGLVIFGGKLADLVGYRNCIIAGMLCLALGMICVGLSHSFPLLIAGRVITGLAGALTKPAILAFVGQSFAPGRERMRALGFYYTCNGFGAGLGFVAGGILVGAFGWRPSFLAEGIVAFVGVLIAILSVPAAAKKTTTSLDIPGTVLIITTNLFVIYTLSSFGKHAWNSQTVIVLASLSIVSMIMLIGVESRTKNPALPLSLFRLPNFVGSLFGSFFACSTNGALLVLVPLYLQQVVKYPTSELSLFYLPLAIGPLIFGRLIIPRLIARFGAQSSMIVGFVTLGTLALLLSFFRSAHLPLIPLIFTSLDMFGFLLIQTATATEVTAHAPTEARGVASGVYVAAIDVAPAIGVALAFAGLQPKVPGAIENFSLAFLIVVGIAATGAIFAAGLVKRMPAILGAGRR